MHIQESEAARRQALESYQLLDTAPDEDLDRLTRLAAEICGTPIAAVSLIDTHRQWFKARVGLDAPETPRDVAFCAHTIRQDIPMVVRDAQTDARFVDNPLVTGAPHIRFYAGVPLRDPDGHNLGSLCVIDRQPRELSPEKMKVLEALARQAMTLFELRRVAGKLAAALRTVDELSGLLPICAYCREVKDEQGNWSRIETYLAQKKVGTTHGICPTCVEKHFPGMTK
jgi:GAF domain-containing protein